MLSSSLPVPRVSAHHLSPGTLHHHQTDLLPSERPLIKDPLTLAELAFLKFKQAQNHPLNVPKIQQKQDKRNKFLTRILNCCDAGLDSWSAALLPSSLASQTTHRPRDKPCSHTATPLRKPLLRDVRVFSSCPVHQGLLTSSLLFGDSPHLPRLSSVLSPNLPLRIYKVHYQTTL